MSLQTRANPLHPDEMSEDERIAEVVAIVAAGFVRLNARQSSRLSADAGESSVDLPRNRSGHATRERHAGSGR
jgi:hypothetical protein